MKIEIHGRQVEVDDNFKDMSEDEQHKVVDEIASSFGPITAAATAEKEGPSTLANLGGGAEATALAYGVGLPKATLGAAKNLFGGVPAAPPPAPTNIPGEDRWFDSANAINEKGKIIRRNNELAKRYPGFERVTPPEPPVSVGQRAVSGLENLRTSKPGKSFSTGYNAMDALQHAGEGPLSNVQAGASALAAAAPWVEKHLPGKLKNIAKGLQLGVPAANYVIDKFTGQPVTAPEQKATGGAVQHFAGGKLATAAKMAAKMSPAIEGSLGKILPSAAFKAAPEQTVTNPLRNAFPGIYKRPDVIAQEAAARVAPESDALKRLFGVTRDDLYEMGKGRVGNISGVLPGAAANPKGSKAAVGVMNPSNEQRLLDVLSESEKYPALVKGMDPWYIMDPAYKRLEELVGPEEAIKKYKQLNTLTGMASPGSDVLTEMNRGTAANYLATQGRFNDFVDYAGKPIGARGADFPEDIRSVLGHPYHKTAQATPMQQYLDSGQVQMSSPKVPMYIDASGVPQTGFQTDMPVGDAHWSRAVGLADTRGTATRKGKEVVPGASVSNPEMSQLGPWWRDKIASQAGLESVPAQARAWGAFSPQTGVESPIGAPKLELLATKIMEAANRYGVSPEQARDMILKGEGYAGKKKGGKVKKGKKK